jgi:NADPH-dependent ferric siderophore reductase
VIGLPDGLNDMACTVPSRPAGDLNDEQMLAKARGSSRWDLTVVETGRIAERMLRLTLSAHGLEKIEWQPAQDFTLLVTRDAGRDIRRRYSIASQDHNTIRFDVYLHGQGIGSSWAQALRPGDTVSGIGPRGKFVLNSTADWMVLIGDETSLPGIHAMLAATDRAAHVVVEIDDLPQWQHLGAGARAATEWTWLPRGFYCDDRAVVALPDSGTVHGYVSGEADRVRYWRTHLESLGVDPLAITHKAYWGAGRANATHGEPLE